MRMWILAKTAATTSDLVLISKFCHRFWMCISARLPNDTMHRRTHRAHTQCVLLTAWKRWMAWWEFKALLLPETNYINTKYAIMNTLVRPQMNTIPSDYLRFSCAPTNQIQMGFKQIFENCVHSKDTNETSFSDGAQREWKNEWNKMSEK